MADLHDDSQLIDENIISKIKSGDKSAYVLLADKYRKSIAIIVGRFCVSDSEREDLMQEGYIALYNASLSYDPSKTKFSTFATVCIKRRLLNWISKNDKNPGMISLNDLCDFECSELGIVQNDFEESIILKNEINALFEKTKKGLSSLELRVFELYLQGHTNREISEILSIDIKSCENTVFRIKSKLKKLRAE